jgi:hypothetical protein
VTDAFISIADAPLDAYTVPDVGDEEPKLLETEAAARLHAHAAFVPPAKTAPKPVVPFTHPIGLGSVGRDVIGVKRALWKANGHPVPVDATMSFGEIAVKSCRRSSTSTGCSPTVCSARRRSEEARPVLRPVRVPALRGLRAPALTLTSGCVTRSSRTRSGATTSAPRSATRVPPDDPHG